MSWKDDVWGIRKATNVRKVDVRKIKTPTGKYDAQKAISAMTDDMVGFTVFRGGEATIEESDIKDFLNSHSEFIKKNGQTYDEIIGLLEDGGFNVE